MPDLKYENISVAYGRARVIENLSLEVRSGELVTILGANGAGKSTLMNSTMGLVNLTSGHVVFDGENIDALSTPARVELGMTLVPERRELFGRLDVESNLLLGSFKAPENRSRTLEKVYALFPKLAERRRQRASTLSGGEQQMLAIGRALMAKPRLLLLDEPSIGLAPLIIQGIFEVIKRLRENGLTIVLVEQNANLALSVADRGYVLEVGKIALEGSSVELLADSRLKEAYLGGARGREHRYAQDFS